MIEAHCEAFLKAIFIICLQSSADACAIDNEHRSAILLAEWFSSGAQA